eukprot:4375497-Pyramimonas_sp.AAC.1
MVMFLCGETRDASDFSERIQCELGHAEDQHLTFVAHGRPPSRHGRSASRQVWRRTNRSDDDEEEWEAEDRHTQRR